MKSYQLASLVLLALTPLNSSLAEEVSPRDTLHAGIAAFKEGDLATARQLFEQARNAGLTSSALQYNLGVVYFRLERYSEAEAAFLSLLDTPHAPLARYNLGLVFKAQGQHKLARRWFHQAAEPSSPEQIRSLANRQLQTQKQSAPDSSPPSNIRTIGLVSLAMGYDDNIASTPDSETTEESGVFADGLASGRVYLGQPGGGAVILDAAAYTRQYPDRQARLEVTYDRIGCFWPDVLVMDCQLSGFAAAVQGGSGFSAYDGGHYGAAMTFEKTLDRWDLSAGYRLELDRRDDLRTEQEFFSLSPTRHSFSAGADYQLTEQLTLGAKQAIRFSRYSDPHQLEINGSLESETRDDTRYRTALLAGYRLSEQWALGAELSWIDNQSSLERYDYNRTEILISLDAVF